MLITLHAGTHKTGTSSIQNMMAHNHRLLIEKNVYYCLNYKSGRNVNFLASDIINGHFDSAAAVLKEFLFEAKRLGCKHMILSAESFFGMTTNFCHLGGVSQRLSDYWLNEESAIASLKKIFHPHEVRVVFYLRNQVEFIDSFYNQCVKASPGYRHAAKTFLKQTKLLLDYRGHMSLWAAHFGTSNVAMYSYDVHKKSVLFHFLKNVVLLTDMSDIKFPKADVNQRLSPETLVVKQRLNCLELGPVQSYYAYVKLLQHNRSTEHVMPSIDYRFLKVVASNCQRDNERLISDFALCEAFFTRPDFSIMSNKRALNYELISDIETKFWDDFNSPILRMQIGVHRLIRLIFLRNKWLLFLYRPFKLFWNKRRIKQEFNG